MRVAISLLLALAFCIPAEAQYGGRPGRDRSERARPRGGGYRRPRPPRPTPPPQPDPIPDPIPDPVPPPPPPPLPDPIPEPDPTPIPPPAEPSDTVFLGLEDLPRLSPDRFGWSQVTSMAGRWNGNIPTSYWVPLFSQGEGPHRRAKAPLHDMHGAFANAIVWQTTGDPIFADFVREQCLAWLRCEQWPSRSEVINYRAADSGLAWCYHAPNLIIAASLTQDMWTDEEIGAFQAWLIGGPLDMSTYGGRIDPNNWSSWGMCNLIAINAYLGMDLRDLSMEFMDLVDHQIDSRDEYHLEVHRESGKGVGYSQMCAEANEASYLMLIAAGMDVTAIRPRMVRAAEKIAGWIRRPSSFPYHGNPQQRPARMGFFGSIPSNHPDVLWILQTRSPLRVEYVGPLRTFTHGR